MVEKARTTLSSEDKDVVMDVASFVTGYVAEVLPAQVIETDKKTWPHVASKLAVQKVGSENEFVGSFDLVVKIRSGIGVGTWRRWNNKEGAIDIKVTGASEAFGLNSPTMRRWLATGRLVMKAARKSPGCRLKDCSFVAYLVRRPRGPIFTGRGRVHLGAYAFVAYDVNTLIAWDPFKDQSAPKAFLSVGDLIISGKVDDTLAPTAPMLPPPRRPNQVDRWKILEETKATSGWCNVEDFVDVFKKKGKGEIKYATKEVLKRLRASSCTLKDADPQGKGRPRKTARVCDLKKVYKGLS